LSARGAPPLACPGRLAKEELIADLDDREGAERLAFSAEYKGTP